MEDIIRPDEIYLGSFIKFLVKYGIDTRYTMSVTPQQNGCKNEESHVIGYGEVHAI